MRIFRRAVVAAGAATIFVGAAVAFQQRIVGGYALDANLNIQSGGFNRPSGRTGAPGVERARYSVAARTSRGGSAVARPSYSAIPQSRSVVLGSGIGATVITSDPRTGQTNFRSDPLRVPRYDALRVRETIPRYGTAGVRKSGSPYKSYSTAQPAQRAPTAGRAASGSMISNRSYSLRAPR